MISNFSRNSTILLTVWTVSASSAHVKSDLNWVCELFGKFRGDLEVSGDLIIQVLWLYLSVQWVAWSKYQIRTISPHISCIETCPPATRALPVGPGLRSESEAADHWARESRSSCWRMCQEWTKCLKRITMPVPNSPHLYRRVINVEPPPEREEDFESPGMTKPPVPRFTSKFEAGRFTSGVEAFLSESEEADRPRQTNFRKESVHWICSH